MKKPNLWIAIAILLVCAGNAFAGEISYFEQATVSGSLGGTSFANALITLGFGTSDGSVVPLGGGLFVNDPGPGYVSFTVEGIGSGTFLDDIYAFVNQGTSTAGFSDSNLGGDVLDTVNPGFAVYDLTTDINLTGSAIINPDLTFLTTDGTLQITLSSDSTFSAMTGPAPIPEPSSLLLFGTSLLGLAGAVRRKLGC